MRLQPLVWLWVLSDMLLGFCGSNDLTIFAQSSRAARSLAISMKMSLPTAQKNDSRGAKSSMPSPARMPERRYSRPSAIV